MSQHDVIAFVEALRREVEAVQKQKRRNADCIASAGGLAVTRDDYFDLLERAFRAADQERARANEEFARRGE